MAHDDPTGPATTDVIELEAPATQAPTIAEPTPAPAAAPGVDPTGAGAGVQTAEAGADEAAVGAALPLPVIPLPLGFRNVSGRYRGQTGGFQLELRVDLDGHHPLNRLSGDFFSVSGGTVSYFGSFIVNALAIIRTPAHIIAKGLGAYTFPAGAPVVQVTIPRRRLLHPAAPATVQFFTTAGHPGATYICAYEAAGLRRVALETDVVSDVTTPVFSSYDTALLPSGGPARTLSVAKAYAEAGVEMDPTPASGAVINIAEAGANHTWSDAELHASMVSHFSQWQAGPHWGVWQLVCQLHDLGPGLYGIMFDASGANQRQGCAVFHAGIGGVTAEKLRLQLYTYTHELGHCFNLLHSWQKSYAVPPGVNRPAALSWMNYPWNYPSGAAAFWNAFPFQFDDPELVHVRHGFRNEVIMGGDPFATGAAIIDPQTAASPVRDDSGLELAIEPIHPSYALGEPVAIKLALRTIDRRGKIAHPHLDPRASMTTIFIRRPNGEVVRYEPYIDHLMDSEPRFLPDGEVIEESAYIGYGAGGLYFDRPGTYKVRGVYHAPDGSQVFSAVSSIRVRHPVTQVDEELADLLIGDEQGALFYLLGSDSESLASGNRAFDIVLDKHAKHPLATYVQAARGVNLARTFVTVDERQATRASVRKAQLGDAQGLIATATAASSRIDDRSKASFLRRLAREQRRAGDEEGATANLNRAETLRPSRPGSPA